MQLSVVTDEISQDIDHALTVCRDLGIETVELRTISGKNIVFHDEPSLQHIKALLEDGHFQVSVIDSPFLKSHLWSQPQQKQLETFDLPETQWEMLERSIEIAHLLGASYVRSFSFWRLPDPENARGEILSILQEAVRRVEHAGLRLVLENEHACNIATGAEAGWYLQALPSPAFGLTWDPGNEAALLQRIHANDIAFRAHPFPDGYAHVRGRVLHMHVKDVDAQGRFVKMGTGIMDYADQFRALLSDGYTGLLALETHYTANGNQEAASRESFAVLRELYQQNVIKR